jgi:hypothetical protein
VSTMHTVAAAAASCTGECQKSGPLGLVVILVLCVACYFLFKSMSRHLRRVREDFPADAGDPPATPGHPAPPRQPGPAGVAQPREPGPPDSA